MKRFSPDIYIKRIDDLRKEMSASGIDMYYVPCSDFHMSEYVCDHFKCREYLSGFDGSNGVMVITDKQAFLWTDGRYFIQASEQLEGTGISLMKMGEPGVPKVTDFIKDNISKGQKLGFDGRCVGYSFFEKIYKPLSDKNVSIDSGSDLVGKIWADRPSLPLGKAWLLDEKYTGTSRKDRISKVRDEIKKAGCDGLILSSLDDIAWLFGFRGSDVEFNPVTLSYAYISADEALLFMDEDKAADICDDLSADGVNIRAYSDVFGFLENLDEGKRVMTDFENSSTSIVMSLKDGIIKIDKPSPVVMIKACKTSSEIENIRSAHVSDGAALTHILYDLKNLSGTKELSDGKVSELDISEKLLSYRKESEDFIEESFAPIVATGAHGAIVHYEPSPETNSVIREGDMVLIDTGGQYLRGTTDVTRTVIIGTPTDKMKKYYTAVLKGNIALSETVFRSGASGKTLDMVARKPLWDLGLDYNHGTGHGVGYLLNVHEGPQNISFYSLKSVPMKAGMITSDEPGVYVEGEFGIRIENMTVCVPKDTTEFGDFLGFDVLTLAPFDRDLIDTDMLTSDEIKVIDEYHEQVYQKLSGFFDEKIRLWLRDITRPLIDF